MSSSDVDFRNQLRHGNRKNDASLCKLDVNAKTRTAGAGSVGFFKLA